MGLSGAEFEQRVRTVARLLFDASPGDGSSELQGGRERDCIIRSEFITHYIECTTLTTLAKTKDDAEKMIKWRRSEEAKGNKVQLWIITKEEPTAHQKEHCRSNNIKTMSLKEFEKSLVDADMYLRLRERYQFGSATDPFREDTTDVSQVKYQRVKLLNIQSRDYYSIDNICDNLESGDKIALIGEYGSGKSITLREVYKKLKSRYSSGVIPQIPIFINLKDHWGQSDPIELLERHARRIGYSNPYQLTRGFHAGKLILIIDGFDEIAPTPVTIRDSQRTKELRRQAVQAVSELVKLAKPSTGIIISGRSNYFESVEDLKISLMLPESTQILTTNEFDEEEAISFLRLHNIDGQIPTWLPRKPFFIASLIARGYADEIFAGSSGDPIDELDHLIDRVCIREANIHRNTLDAAALRRLIEEISDFTRSTGTGLGPIPESSIDEIFNQITGSFPDVSTRPLLYRLPGLSPTDTSTKSRYFIDDQILDILRSAKLVNFALDPYTDPRASSWKFGSRELTISAALNKINLLYPTVSEPNHLVNATSIAIKSWQAPTLALDLVQLAQYAAEEKGHSNLEFKGIQIEGHNGEILNLDLEDLPIICNLTISSAVIGCLNPSKTTPNGFFINDCLIHKIIGITSQDEIPEWISPDCVFEEFDSGITNNRILQDESVPGKIRVLQTILRKLYQQRGIGRKEGALYRGLEQSHRDLVPEILAAIRNTGFASPSSKRGETVWYPSKDHRIRADKIIDDPKNTKDPLLSRLSE